MLKVGFSESTMFRVDAPFGGSGKREAVSTGDKTMTGGRSPPPLVAVKIALAIFTGDKTMASVSLQSRPNNF